jgi:ubiquinone/menaquinone biosynthesis C-methylase UbiE
MRIVDPNLSIYEQPRVVSEYAELTYLQVPETILFFRYYRILLSGRVLDIGVGGGRTTLYLREITKNYVGVDYSTKMVDACRKRFPELPFFHCDARDLSQFAHGSFIFVLFSFNGLDCITHDDRKLALNEIHRVLSPGGLFMFSSHNRNFVNAIPHPKLRWSLSPLRQYHQIMNYLTLRRRHHNLSRLQVFTEEYALINDGDQEYSCLYYFIAKSRQIAQLQEAGFEMLEMFDLSGSELKPHSCDIHTSSIYYLARKVARSDV